MTIRPAGPEDLEVIAAIQAASPEASQWKPEDYLNYTCLVCTVCPLPNGRGSVMHRAGAQGASGGQPTPAQNSDRKEADRRSTPIQAFIVTRQLVPGEHEILNLAVAPAARRLGLARALLSHVLEAQGSWFLEVRASNQAAIRLYESTGFRRTGTRPSYYQDSTETAIVMHFQK